MSVYEFPASAAQRRMWTLTELDPGEVAYNIGWMLWLDGPLAPDVLERALVAAVDRHESLRTTFRGAGGATVQVIDDAATLPPVRPVSLEHLPPGDRDRAARDVLRGLTRVPFDLVTGPLLRVCLLRLGPDRHVLGIAAHHSILDGWSFRVLFDEIARDYEAIHDTGDPVVEEPDIQYADFAMWQIDHAADGQYAPAERYWRDVLGDAPQAIPLPVDFPYPAAPTFDAETLDLTIDPATMTALRRTAADHGTTLFAVLLAAYALVLARVSGVDDLLVAVPMAARVRAETESLVGLCMNTVAVRVRIDGDPTVGEFIRAVHAAAARALTHQELPFARVMDLVPLQRSGSRAPLLQVMFAMEESWQMAARGGLGWDPELIDHGTTKFEHELTVTDHPDGARVRCVHNRDLFGPESGRMIADGFRLALAADPATPVRDVDLMPADVADLVTVHWPAGPPDGDHPPTAIAMMRAACVGDTVIAEGSDGVLTGDDATERAGRIAAELRRLGVRPQDRVGILLHRGVRLIPALLGTWWAGAAYVPMDPIYPDPRLRTMIADAGVTAIIVDSGAADAPMLDVPIAVLDLATLPAEAPMPAPVDVPGRAAAYTLFTSGSTGRPKAVTVTQSGLATLLAGVGAHLALGREDRLLAVSTFAFDIAVAELLLPALHGATAVIATAAEAADGGLLRDALVRHRATAMQGTPATWRMLVDAGGVPDGVRTMLTAGEPLPRDLADRLLAAPGARLWNLYGPSETTVYSAGALVEPAPAPIELRSIIPGTRVYLLDPRLRPVPPGVIGEVCIGGPGVGDGYRGAPGATAAVFVPDPFGPPSARLYRTGDLGRWRRDGGIELVGRADRQVKIRGFRVETGEIEVALRGHPDIAQAVVVARGNNADTQGVRLVGYVVGAPIDPADLSTFLRQTLPHYMVPATFVRLPRLPLTGTGKIDLAALPEPDWAGAAGPDRRAPRTPLEADLAVLFADVLGLTEPVGVLDNFFALGGHSLTASGLIARIRAEYGVNLPVRSLFDTPTVAGIAALIAAAGQAPPAEAGSAPIPSTDAAVDALIRAVLDGTTEGSGDR